MNDIRASHTTRVVDVLRDEHPLPVEAIGGVLCISKAEVVQALQFLQRFGVADENETGEWELCST